jgi:nucleoid-associated protein YgaU
VADAPDSQQVAVLKSDEEGVTLLQPQPTAPASVTLDTIGYSDDGTLQLSGRASAEAVEVRAYLNNRLVAGLPVRAGGQWRGDVPDIAPGVYTLRIDALDAQGEVSSRLETPFKREAPEILAAAEENSEQGGPVRAVTVQAGDTLWAIARDRYGNGVLYVQVFEANRASIRDPDLIYPGQVFDLPGE